MARKSVIRVNKNKVGKNVKKGIQKGLENDGTDLQTRRLWGLPSGAMGPPAVGTF